YGISIPSLRVVLVADLLRQRRHIRRRAVRPEHIPGAEAAVPGVITEMALGVLALHTDRFGRIGPYMPGGGRALKIPPATRRGRWCRGWRHGRRHVCPG